ncbi:uncharacterized protein B0H18DRAFT_1179209 [Fomitopsis serialis]|uniref:uncharacterized protein n=1 Tax=Fomitopsis serialis TaxID=139415 RepID=UPI002008961F|nr:uncharacterized protein B0H18DRAFT_1179209 [Neoantrodia serialis]KAH9923486.1 hypothetical protein B0H18DRAFT_1179209 [Neoantrodia serialis]
MASAYKETAPATSLFTGADGNLPYMHLPEATLTFSRPLGSSELGWLHTVTDDAVVQACAALRLRHPLLVSKVAFHTTAPPSVVYASPLTRAHALREATAQIEFHTFHDQDATTEALRDRWLSPTPEDALDMRNGTCSLYWARDVDPRSGKYILGFMMPHFITDGRRRLNLVRCMLDLLPGRAQRELAAHFAGEVPVVEIPPALDSLLPDMGNTEPAELAKAKTAFDELVQYRSKPTSGLVPDGVISEDNLHPRVVRQTWSAEETKYILKACKAHSVTITHLANVASAFACLQRPGAAQVNGFSSGEDAYYFELCQALDINAKLPQVSRNGETETAVRIVTYPVLLSVPCTAAVESAGTIAIWDAARQFKERHDAYVNSPYFWHFTRFYRAIAVENYMTQRAGKTFMPYMSSMGDLKGILPTRYSVEASHAGVNEAGSHSAEIRVLDSIAAEKVDPQVASFLLYTFDDRLNLQFKWNAGRTSDNLINGWFGRVVEIILQAAGDEGPM